MKVTRSLSIAAVLGTLVIATAGWQQSSSQNSSSSQSQSGNGQSSASASGSARSGGSAGSSGSAIGTTIPNPTHGIVFHYEASQERTPRLAEARQNYVDRLRSNGILVLGVDWKDRTGEVLLIVAQSDDQAKAVADAHPFVSAKAATYEWHEVNSMYFSGGQSVRTRRAAGG